MIITRLAYESNYRNYPINNKIAKLNQATKEKKLTVRYKNRPDYTGRSYENIPSLITYVLTIHMSKSNIMLNVTNKEGSILIHSTSGKQGIKGSQKTKKFSLISILKDLLYKFNFLKNKSIVLKFKGFKYNQKLIIKKLKEKFHIKSIIYENLVPHNGCRPKKIRRK